MFIKSCGVARWTYNWGLSKRKELYETKQGAERLTTWIRQQNEIVVLKKTTHQWLGEVSKRIPQQALRDLEFAYVRFFRSKKMGGVIGSPKYKKKGVRDSFTIASGNFDRKSPDIEVVGSLVKIPRIGWVRTKEETTKLAGRILSITVSREVDRWYCSLCVEVNKPTPSQIVGDVIGIDLGVKTFATISDGKSVYEIVSPRSITETDY